MSETSEDIHHKSRKILQRFVWWGGGGTSLCLHHTNVYNIFATSITFCDFAGPYLSLSNLANLLSLRRFDGFSLTGPCEKLKKPWKGVFSLIAHKVKTPCANTFRKQPPPTSEHFFKILNFSQSQVLRIKFSTQTKSFYRSILLSDSKRNIIK